MKVGIVSGVISSVIVILFIQPILGLVWDLVLGLGRALQQGYVDRIYRNAALGERNLLGAGTYMAVLTLAMFATTYMVVSTASAAAEANPERAERISRLVKWARLITTLGGTLVFGMLTIVFSLSMGMMEITASFNQRLTVLAPALSDAEYKTLKARWASMRGEGDYLALVKDMDQRAKTLNVRLPAVREP